MTPARQARAAIEQIAKPVVWSVAGNDTGGGAGLSADARAAAAFGVHLCPVVAALTAQNSLAVTRIDPVAPELLDAQLAALADDLPPAAIKTGLLGSAANVAVLARWVDRLRQRGPLALVVDPVLGASTGAAFADAATLAAYRDLLLPRATLVTPNGREARTLAGLPSERAPALAAALRAQGAQAVAVTGGDDVPAPAPALTGGAGTPAPSGDATQPPALHWALDWVDTAHASGWLALPRIDTPHTHGTGCTFATSAACALALGFVPADALVLAKMATAQALRAGHAAGQGAGPVVAGPGFGTQPDLLPAMSWADDSSFYSCLRLPEARYSPVLHQDLGLYAIVDSADRVRQVVAAGVRTVQLRIKTPHQHLRAAVADALASCHAAGATLVVNDHWRLAAELGAPAIHLGQEDLAALGPAGRAELAASRLRLGISSHSLWELCRVRALRPWYAACGPVWPTLTKAMPWAPQGLDNLAWWVHMAGAPVVAIGGILEHAQAEAAAASGAAGVCVVRGLGEDPALQAPGWRAAIARGRAAARLPVPALPHPSLARS
jgi:hydroxymethylpyrimidine kinase/phosphomethylpyrimidine kinase/thiamine-phosphate diphosphorylase